MKKDENNLKILKSISEETKLSPEDFRRIKEVKIDIDEVKDRLKKLEKKGFVYSKKEIVHGLSKKYFLLTKKGRKRI